jgi:hypothetical protein
MHVPIKSYVTDEHGINNIRLSWYMKLFIPCSSVTYDSIGTWNYLCHAHLLHTNLLVHEIIYVTDEHGLINVMYQ